MRLLAEGLGHKITALEIRSDLLDSTDFSGFSGLETLRISCRYDMPDDSLRQVLSTLQAEKIRDLDVFMSYSEYCVQGSTNLSLDLCRFHALTHLRKR